MAGSPKRKQDLKLLEQPQFGDRVLEMVASGAQVSAICINTGLAKKAVMEWLDAPERAEVVARARAQAARILVEEAVQIADGERPAVIEGENVYDTNRDRLRIQARQWIAERTDRQQWGQAQQQINISLHGLHIDALRATRAREVEVLPQLEEGSGPEAVDN